MVTQDSFIQEHFIADFGVWCKLRSVVSHPNGHL